MKLVITLLKPLSFLPAILMMLLIYGFSAQTGEVSGELSYKISYQIVETKNEILGTNKSYDELAADADSIHYYVRKAAHMTEYCVLAIAISFPLYVYKVRGIWLVLLAGMVCVGFAGLDEYHQSFVGGRGPSVKDVGIDSIGALIGIILVQAFCWSTLHNPAGKKRKKKKHLPGADDRMNNLPGKMVLFQIHGNFSFPERNPPSRRFLLFMVLQ